MIDLRNEPSDPGDVELQKTSEEPEVEAGTTARHTGAWVIVAALVTGAALAVYLVFGTRQPPAPSEPKNAAAGAHQPPPSPLGGQPEAITVPPLDESDAVVRELVKGLSSHPSVAAWLATDGLIRNFTVVVANTAEGTSPVVHLRRLRPAAPFAVVDTRDGPVIDPASYHRYDAIAAAAASIDPAGAARLYATLKPRIEEAYRDLNPDTPFDRTLERAIVVLLQTPVVRDPIRVRAEGGTGYAFADPALDRLTKPQKQLLRAGPDNVQAIQSSLRSIALALGIPAARLPQPSMTR